MSKKLSPEVKAERKQYSDLRKQALKAEQKLISEGIKVRGKKAAELFPTLKDLNKAKINPKGLIKKAQKYIKTHDLATVQAKEAARKAKHAEAQKRYQKRQKKKKIYKKNLLKAAQKFGLKNIDESNITDLEQYLDYMDAMNANTRMRYRQQDLDSFNELAEIGKDSGKSLNQVLADFKKYMDDRTAMAAEQADMKGYSSSQIQQWIEEYIGKF